MKHPGESRALTALAVLSAIFFLFAGATSATPHWPPRHPTTYYVDDDAAGADTGTSWADAFTDLQSALDAAVSG